VGGTDFGRDGDGGSGGATSHTIGWAMMGMPSTREAAAAELNWKASALSTAVASIPIASTSISTKVDAGMKRTATRPKGTRRREATALLMLLRSSS
jgi:hypothetical protein